ncbi:MAG: hypothetical protein ABJD38_18340, partial [Aurantimonas coralicida]
PRASRSGRSRRPPRAGHRPGARLGEAIGQRRGAFPITRRGCAATFEVRMPKSVAHQRAKDKLAELLGSTYDAQAMAEILHRDNRDPALASAMRRLAGAAEDLERAATRAGRPLLSVVR